MTYGIRYKPDSDLGRRFTGYGSTFATRAEAEALLRVCCNAAVMEVIQIDQGEEQ